MVDSDDDGGDYADVMAASPLDLLEYANSYAFVIDMPGLDLSYVRVQVKADNVLLLISERRRVDVEGERRRMRKFTRKVALPENANTGMITTVSRNGVLTVTVEKLPKAIEELLGSPGDEREVRIDRLSLLPDELLVRVLSLLSFKEATATSILCRCWRYLHTITAKLDFDGTKLLRKAKKCNFKGFGELRRKYVRWVDDVVRLNQSSRLEKFRVVFYLRESDTQHIDEWVRFALSRKVESLELMSSWQKVTKEEHYSLNLHKWNYDLNFMKKLSTHMVKVSGEAVEMLLRSCPLLEQVSIAASADLLGLEIIKPFPSLRSLEIIDCWNLSSVVVDDSNIVSFKYSGKRVNKVVLVNVPLLTEIWMYGICTDRSKDVVEMFSSVLPQLHTFKIGVMQLPGLYPKFCSLVEMSNLKQLVVDIGLLHADEDLLPLIEFIRACPRLQRFVIEEAYKNYRPNNYVEVEPIEIRVDTNAHRRIMRAYRHLKEVKFVGYRGVSNHFKLLKHLVENAIALETIVVDPWGFKDPPYTFSFDPIPRRKYNDEVFARANALKECVPLGINVEIL